MKNRPLTTNSEVYFCQLWVYIGEFIRIFPASGGGNIRRDPIGQKWVQYSL